MGIRGYMHLFNVSCLVEHCSWFACSVSLRRDIRSSNPYENQDKVQVINQAKVEGSDRPMGRFSSGLNTEVKTKAGAGRESLVIDQKKGLHKVINICL